jgi:nicotinate-nucleotide--dimethylbenzimidazole phosphoribosyltransferase
MTEPASSQPDAVDPLSTATEDTGEDVVEDFVEPPDPLEAAIEGIDYPDAEAAHAAKLRQYELAVPLGSLGLLDELSSWAASVQGQCPPSAFGNTRAVLFAGDHGIAAAGVSAYASTVTTELLAIIDAGGGPLNVLAEAAGVHVRVLDLAVDADTDPGISQYKIRRGSGRIDVEDALTEEQTQDALRAGISIANQEIDAGAELLIAADLGVANSTPASALISVLTDFEPIKVVGRGSGIDDDGWIRKCAAIRDARRRAWPYRTDVAGLLAVAGSADLAAMTGFLLQAANRRTPVLLDGLVVSAAALAAQLACPRVVRWFQAAHLSPEPAHDIALRRLGLRPIVNLEISLGQGTGALVALPILRAATLTLAKLAGFEDARSDDAGSDDAGSDDAGSGGAGPADLEAGDRE